MSSLDLVFANINPPEIHRSCATGVSTRNAIAQSPLLGSVLHQIDIASAVEGCRDVSGLGRPLARGHEALPERLVKQTAQSKVATGAYEVCALPRTPSRPKAVMFFQLVERRKVSGCPTVVEKFRELSYLLGADHEMS